MIAGCWKAGTSLIRKRGWIGYCAGEVSFLWSGAEPRARSFLGRGFAGLWVKTHSCVASQRFRATPISSASAELAP
jgi:hypothetical protein